MTKLASSTEFLTVPNIFSHVPSGKVREVSHMLKAIHAQGAVVA